MSYLYFYKGKFSTENGLRYALMKEGKIWSSRGAFYLYPKTETHYLSFDELKEKLFNDGEITSDEYEHFQRWLKTKEISGEVKALRDYTFYHCAESNGLKEEFADVLKKIMERHPGLIETEEEVINNYVETLSDVQRQTFSVLPTYRQSLIATKWRSEKFNKENK